MNDFDHEVEKNLPLVSYVLQKYYHKWNEDMFQTGCLGLVRAVKTYNSNKNMAKSTYYVSCIKNEIGNIYRHINSDKCGKDITIFSLNTKVEGSNNQLEYIDIIPETYTIENKFINNEFLRTLIKELTHKERIIIIYSFGLFGHCKKTQAEIADLVGLYQSDISRYIKRILIKLKGKIENESNNRRL